MQMTRTASCEVEEEEEQMSRIRHMQSLYIKDGYSSYDHTAASTISTISILVAERPGCDDIVHRAHWLLTCGES